LGRQGMRGMQQSHQTSRWGCMGGRQSGDTGHAPTVEVRGLTQFSWRCDLSTCPRCPQTVHNDTPMYCVCSGGVVCCFLFQNSLFYIRYTPVSISRAKKVIYPRPCSVAHSRPVRLDQHGAPGRNLATRRRPFFLYSANTVVARRHLSLGGRGTIGLLYTARRLRGYTAVVPWIPRSAADPPVFFSQSALQQPTGKSLDQTLDVATCKLAGRAPKVILGSLNKGVLL
jgi:hypothetical protein